MAEIDEANDEQVVSVEIQSQICALISLGCSFRRAAKLSGVPESTVRSTMGRDPEFSERVRKAELSREVTPLNHLRNAQEKSWRAAAYMMERINPQDFSRRWPPQPTNEDLASIMDQFGHAMWKRISHPEDRRAVAEWLQGVLRSLQDAEPTYQQAPREKPSPENPSWVERVKRAVNEPLPDRDDPDRDTPFNPRPAAGGSSPAAGGSSPAADNSSPPNDPAPPHDKSHPPNTT